MNRFKIFIIGIALSLFVITGCDKDGDKDDVVLKYLVDYEQFTPSVAFNMESSKTLLAQFGLGDVASLMKYDIRIYKITYKTLFEGDSILVSGIVSLPVPLDKKETFPMLSYQHGTIVKKSDAPSVNINNEFITYLASTGMVVAIADYIGFGASSSEFHPFMINEYTVNAVLDMIRATKELIKIEKPFDLNGNLYLYGYSQGGSATLDSLSDIENKTANSDIKVTAAVCGSGAYDLAEMRKWVVKQARYEQPYYFGYLLESYSRYANIGNDYSLVFSTEFADKIPPLFNGTTSAEAINGSFGTYHVGELFNDNFEVDSLFNTKEEYIPMIWAFNENKIEAWPISTPLSIHYGSEDIWVPGDQSLKLFQQFQANGSGAKVKLERFSGNNHYTTFGPSIAKSVTWFLGFE